MDDAIGGNDVSLDDPGSVPHATLGPDSPRDVGSTQRVEGLFAHGRGEEGSGQDVTEQNLAELHLNEGK